MKLHLKVLDLASALLYLVLAPVLIFQAGSVRRRTMILSPPHTPERGVLGSGEELSVLVVGDSAGAGVGAPVHEQSLLGYLTRGLSSFRTVTWATWAEPGHDTRDTLELLEQKDDEPFHTVVVSLGVNDVTSATPLASWLLRQELLVELLRSKFSARRILLTAVPPMGRFPLLPQPLRFCLGVRAKLFNRALLQLFAGEPDVAVITFKQPFQRDMMAMDGFHPGPEAYAVWAAELINELEGL